MNDDELKENAKFNVNCDLFDCIAGQLALIIDLA